MDLMLEIRFFESAIEESLTPTFSSTEPYRAQLTVEGCELSLGVELLHSIENAEASWLIQVQGRTVSPDIDYSALSIGAEFFISEGSKMVGRGSVLNVCI